MANNPLYPGYSEKKKGSDQGNPLYPGYYTGKPIPRKPGSKNFIKPIEYDADLLFAPIDEAAEKVKDSPLNFPKWVWDRTIDDTKESLRASIKPSGIDITELDDYAIEDLPGAFGLSLSLDPMDWKDPKKQAGKTFSSWTKTVIGVDVKNILKSDWSDIENAARKKLWHALLGGEEKLSQLEETTKRAMEQRTKTFGDTVTERDKPFDLKNVHVTLHTPIQGSKKGSYRTEKKEDIYKKTIANILGFEEAKQSNKFRDSNFDGFVTSAAEAISTEVEAEYSKIHRALKEAPKDQRDRLNFLKENIDKHKGAIDFFRIKTDTVKEMNAIGELLKNHKKSLRKSIVNVNREENKNNIFNMRDPNVWSGLESALKKARGRSGRLAKLEQAEALFKRGKISGESFRKFERNLRDYDKYVSNAIKTVQQLKSGVISREVALQKLGKIRGGGRNLKGGDIFRNNIQRDLIKDIDYSIKSKSKDSIGGLITDENLRGAGINFHARKLIPISTRLRQEKITGATEELFDALWDGKLAERYLWNNRIKPQLSVFTPDTFISNALKKTNTLGLLIGENFDADKRFGKGSIKAALWAKRHEYKFSLKLDDKFVDKWNIGGLRKNILKLQGGKHFEIVSSLSKVFDFEDAVDLATIKGLLAHTLDFKDNSLLQKLKKQGMSAENIKELEEKIKAFQDKMKQLRGVFGDKVVINAGFQLELIQKLKDAKLPDGYGILRKYAGRLDKIYIKLDGLSRKFRKSKLGKLIAGINNWKTLVAEKVAALVSKLIAELVGLAAASTGVMAVLIPIIKGLVKKIVEKTLEAAQKIMAAILKADFDAVFEVINENVKKALVAFLIIVLPTIIAMVIIVMTIMSIFGITISPADPTLPVISMRGNCDNWPPMDLPDKNTEAGDVAKRAYEIASDLERGFWCGFNKPSDTMNDLYSHAGDTGGGNFLFNYALFEEYGYDITEEELASEGDYSTNLFWCTWMPIKSYKTTVDIGFEREPAVSGMEDFFKSAGGRYSHLENINVNTSQLKSGDLIFFGLQGVHRHVSVIYKITTDYIVTIESNVTYISAMITNSEGGIVPVSLGNRPITGFGLYR